ncbi:hypothetical protein B9479_006425 [Cryptococcus floricola]|uniref:NAA35-like N-terminal domain-containing protein n=1 Tax=Cryptococcus floricola TaxID=2591691 RepID=A0A5D3AT80_9TREE|nr:hypothetical protein B9479_006425 [Cryptococcus floricola]
MTPMQDITSWLTQQCDELPYGELAKPSSFSMMDAMKGLQMMDSKMDTGTRDKLQSTQLFDPNANISAEDLCFIMDRMLALEVSWYRGGNLCQSVYSCLYFHNLYMIEAPSDPLATGNLLTQLVLRAYILLFCKSIDFAYTELAKGNVYEGEDCWLDHYGVPLRVSEDTDTVVAVADDALGWLESEECQLPVFLKNQLVYRLVFRRTRFTMLCDERADGGVYKSDILATEGLAQESADTNQVQVVLESVTHNTSFSSQAQSLKVWKVLLLKDVLTTLAIASQNGPRQRRSLIDLSHQLRERATMAEYQAIPHISQTIHLLRLDCMLDAALGALDLELVHPADEREAWWWIRTVAKARIRGGTESSTIRARWAEAWESIGAGMEILLTAIPLSSLPISNSTRKARFALKYKHYSKAIYMPDGTKRSIGVVPAYEDWIRSQDEMDNNPTFRDT